MQGHRLLTITLVSDFIFGWMWSLHEDSGNRLDRTIICTFYTLGFLVGHNPKNDFFFFFLSEMR